MRFLLSIFLAVSSVWIGNTATAEGQHAGSEEEQLLGQMSFQEVSAFAEENWPEFEVSNQETWRRSVAELSRAGRGTKLDVFFNSSCHDSQREVPRLLGILDELDRTGRRLPFEVRWVAVDLKKKEPVEEVQPREIRRTPTLILSRGNTELGRIVERSSRGLETDLKRLLDGSARGLVSASEAAIRDYLRPILREPAAEELESEIASPSTTVFARQRPPS